METKTSVGKLLEYRGYNDETVEKFDQLALYLRGIIFHERRELLTALMWQFNLRWHLQTLKGLTASGMRYQTRKR